MEDGLRRPRIRRGQTPESERDRWGPVAQSEDRPWRELIGGGVTISLLERPVADESGPHGGRLPEPPHRAGIRQSDRLRRDGIPTPAKSLRGPAAAVTAARTPFRDR